MADSIKQYQVAEPGLKRAGLGRWAHHEVGAVITAADLDEGANLDALVESGHLTRYRAPAKPGPRAKPGPKAEAGAEGSGS